MLEYLEFLFVILNVLEFVCTLAQNLGYISMFTSIFKASNEKEFEWKNNCACLLDPGFIIFDIIYVTAT